MAMSEPLPFGSVLAALRLEQGHRTPYAFFRGSGGQRGLGLTFANYLRFERGIGLPKGWRLRKLLAALELPPGSEKARRLVRAYLVSVLGSEELLEAAPVAAQGEEELPTGWRLALRASTEAISRAKVHLDVEQYRAVAGSPTSYACHAVLSNTEGGMDLAELAEKISAPAAEVKKALKDLSEAKLVKLSGTRARSVFEKNFVAPPARTNAAADAHGRLESYRRQWLERAAPVHAPQLILRASSARLQRYFDSLTEAVNMSAIYGDARRGPDSGMFLVEGRVTPLFRKG
jgi:hypothetical protein